MSVLERIENKVNQLTPNSTEELSQFLDYLIAKQTDKPNKKLKQDWAGGLKDIKTTSVELQKKALDWR